MFADDRPLQASLNLSGSGEIAACGSRAVLNLADTVASLTLAGREALRARAAAVGTDLEFHLVEATRIIEAALCAALTARTLIADAMRIKSTED